jgi:hypothetical protein
MWSDPRTYRVTSAEIPWGGETAKKLADLSIIGGTRVIELPNSAYSPPSIWQFRAFRTQFRLISTTGPGISSTRIQFVGGCACDDLGATRGPAV